MNSRYGVLVARIEQLLTDYGPMTRADIAMHVPQYARSISSVLSRMNRATPATPKRLHVAAWVHDSESGRRYPRAVYALGDRYDARKPKPDPKKRLRTSRANARARLHANSIWTFARSF